MLLAEEILHRLITSEPSRLADLPRDLHGIYALRDHAGDIRYIGITLRLGFYSRINGYHTVGSEGRSHKFSHAYNTGRMWRRKRDNSPDAELAKALRTAFIRHHCQASFVAVIPTMYGELPRLERAVQACAPDGMFAWGSKRDFNPLPEPTTLVDSLLDELRFAALQRDAIERQAALSAGR